MDLHLLRVLLELHRRGTMRAVAKATGYGTSTVSVQLATLERQVGATLLERVGRTVRFTPAGRRLVEHAETIIDAVESARAAVGPDGEANGLLRVAASASALSADLIPVVSGLRRTHPDLRLTLEEREPAETTALLDADEIDLGFVYDFNLVPRFSDNGGTVRYTCATPMRLAVPSGRFVLAEVRTPQQLRLLARESWVVNSRGQEDTDLVERFCALAGFEPIVAHRADSLELVLDFVAADLGVAMVPAYMAPREGVDLLPVSLTGIEATRRMFAVTRPGRYAWPAVALVVDLMIAHNGENDG